MSDFVKLTPKTIRENNSRIRATANEAQLKIIAEVDSAFEVEQRNLNEQFDGELRLRANASALLGVPVDISEVELLNEAIQETKPGNPFWFRPRRGGSIQLYKTYSGTVDRLDRYVYTLEKALIDLALKQDCVMVPVSRPHEDWFTSVSVFGLIKLAFKKLFNRSSTNG
jgi:hypothetical protein